MIKVNLLNSKVSGAAQEDFNFQVSKDTGSSYEKNAAINFLLFLGFVCGLVYYEQMEQSQWSEKSKKIQQQVSSLNSQLEQKRQLSEGTKAAKKEYEELKARVEKLRSLSKGRLTEIKALDYLQTVIPERVWLNQIIYQNKKVAVRGFALTDSDLTDFLRVLEAKPYYKDVILLKANEAKTSEGTIKSFELSSVLGGAE